MKRVLVMGCPGAGKAKLAVRLGRITGLDVYHIKDDRFSERHSEDEKNAWKEAVQKIVDRESWIIEGTQSMTYEMRMARADTVFFISEKPFNCLKKFAKRSLGKKMAKNRDRQRVNRDMLKKILNYRRIMRPIIDDLIEKNDTHLNVIFFENDNEIDTYLEELRTEYAKEK
jgi:adenylate kinase family enzyme